MPRRTSPQRLLFAGSTALMVLVPGVAAVLAQGQDQPPARLEAADPSGVIRTVTADGSRVDTRNPFFQSIGANGRACVTCHVPENGWGLTPAHVRERFEATDGRDPLFASVDGTDSPNADRSTREARRGASGMLLNRGLIRVGLPIPPDAEFSLAACDDPYGYASASELSLFRRPLPPTNLRFLSTVMWDGREVDPAHRLTIQPPGGDESGNIANLLFDLGQQANDATRGHAQGARDLTDTERQQIVDFEMSLTTAQSEDHSAGRLDGSGALGGPDRLQETPFYVGINDTFGGDPHGPFDPRAMSLYDAWWTSSNPRRRSIARGAQLFMTRTFTVTGVRGINDNPALGSPVSVTATCTSCHNAPGAGDHSVALALDIGLTDASRRTPDLPLYTLRSKQTGETIQTTDPGRALITGRWADIGKFKGPILRGLAARAPYFHNGSAATLEDVVEFYNSRFQAGFTDSEKKDLANFLRSL